MTAERPRYGMRPDFDGPYWEENESVKGDLDPILPTMRFRIGTDEHVINDLDDERGIVTVTRLRDGRILQFTTLELRDGYHVEWIDS